MPVKPLDKSVDTQYLLSTTVSLLPSESAVTTTVPRLSPPLILSPAGSIPSAITTLIASPAVTHTPSTIASAPEDTYGPSATLVIAILGGIIFFLVGLILMLLRRRRNAALLSTQTETRTGRRRWDVLHRIFHTRLPADTTPFRLSKAGTGAERGPTDLKQKQGVATHALPAFVTHASAMPARPGPLHWQISYDLSIHRSVMSEDRLPSYHTINRGSPLRGHTVDLIALHPEIFNDDQRMMGQGQQTEPQPQEDDNGWFAPRDKICSHCWAPIPAHSPLSTDPSGFTAFDRSHQIPALNRSHQSGADIQTANLDKSLFHLPVNVRHHWYTKKGR
ncbi:hypothetical protein JB92DRAFT_3168832 [Gautieria morchelliformis]|nr:hypothetical protein JB92DRAFT_3168832 [Gautieria morchelliformis]